MNRRDFLFAAAALQPLAGSLAAADEVGIVLLHGKQGAPAGIVDIARAMQSAGFQVATPQMPWSQSRDYDVPYAAALDEIAAAAQSLAAQGARRIVVGGHSLGANAALAYAGSARPADAVFLLSPGHVPDLPGFRREMAAGVRKAQELVGRGAGEEKAMFPDTNQGRQRQVRATAAAYLSYFDPDGLGAMQRSAAAIPRPLPIFIAVGESENILPYARDRIFTAAPPHSKSQFAAIAGDHFSAPRNALPQLLQWLGAVVS